MKSGEKDFERILMLETSPAVFVEEEEIIRLAGFSGRA
jgi:hypothetical protein